MTSFNNYSRNNAKLVGARIKALRKQNHLTAEGLCELLGFGSPQAIYKWQRGDCYPSIASLCMLSDIFHTTIDYIVRGVRVEDESPLLPFYRENSIEKFDRACA